MSAPHWSEWVRELEVRGEPYVLVTLLGARGSTPRDAGTKMVISRGEMLGTIGGGVLEFEVTRRAKALLADADGSQHVENFPLGEKLGQCCGGSTSVLFECFRPAGLPLYLFGAGHVGKAVCRLLADLPFQVHWVDERASEFPTNARNIATVLCTDDPKSVIAEAKTGAYFLIMTHQHPLDFALMEAALRREDAAYIGVIGSHSKARRFRMRLEHRGADKALWDRVHCPVGDGRVPGKHPQEIAVAIAAQLIAHYHARRADQPAPETPSWKSLQHTLSTASAATNEPEVSKP
ncbi:MAG: xanthine dehydrogenase accessory protein XdhC [Pseudomonadota bacterium]